MFNYLDQMNNFEASLFIVPIALGSSYILYKSSTPELIIARVNNLDSDTDTETKIILLISLIYFVLDFILMIKRYIPQYRIYFIHHLIGIISIGVVHFSAQSMLNYLLAFLSFEVSTIFLNIRRYLREKNINNRLTKIVDAVFIISFFVIRILFGTRVTINLVEIFDKEQTPLRFVIGLPIALQLLNYFWMYRIVMMTMKRK